MKVILIIEDSTVGFSVFGIWFIVRVLFCDGWSILPIPPTPYIYRVGKTEIQM